MAISFKHFSTAYDIHTLGKPVTDQEELQEILGYLKDKMSGAGDLKKAQDLLQKVKNGDKGAIAPLRAMLDTLGKIAELKEKVKQMDAALLSYQRAFQAQEKAGAKKPYDWAHVGKHD